ncbi:MAG: acetylxylan esterase, partial [Bacteroidaceae bacterium]|nr:acetylxylan esterase [Bacteroidaceae bacterium]
LAIALLTTAAHAQIRGSEIQIIVAPDRDGWTYTIGETATFNVQVLRHGTPLKGAIIDYTLGPEMYEDTKHSAVTLKDGTTTIKGSLKQPGFCRLTVTSKINGRTYKASGTAAFSPERLTPVTDCPADFDDFWSQTLSYARSVAPLEATRRLLPERSTEQVNVYEVSFQNLQPGSRTYGILCVPTAPGKYPVMYKVPGAGVRPYTGDVWQASKGCIVLEIGIHGVSVTQPQSFYDNLASGALSCYWNFGLQSRYDSYYRRVIVGAVRGIDYIASLPEWDGKNLGVMGSSQGGFLSIVCAALDKRVSCCAPVHPALCDHAASLKKVACGWPHYFYGKDTKSLAPQIETAKYYDGANFARRINVPCWFSFGYNDDVVPPTTAYATYNIVSSKKEIHPYPQTAHFWHEEQYAEWIEWLDRQLGIGVPAANRPGTTAANLLSRLRTLASRGVMFGHQDSPFYGLSWSNIDKAKGITAPDKNDIQDVCGDLPAVMGFDLGGLEYFSQRNIDGVPFNYERDEILKHHARGGIVTLSWHPINPATNEDAWHPGSDAVAKVLPGGELNAKFNTWLDELIRYIDSLRDSQGNRIPLIFRPWHEMNGAWFWWGKGHCTPAQYKQLFAYTYNYITARGAFDNILWAYS